MIETIERMLGELERGKLTRRQFAVSLATLAAGAVTTPGALAAPTGFHAVSLNHVTVRVPEQSATVHILGVGNSFFGIEQGQSQTATVDHYDFGIAHFNADEVRARLSELNLKFSDKTSKESFKFYDPDGFQVQVNGPEYVGHVS
jgi:hypothetical protein